MALRNQDSWKRQKESLRRVNLPSMIKCRECKRNQLQMRYSNNELDFYRAAIAKQGATTLQIPTCKACKGAPVEDLKCSGCNKIKGLDRFAKTQRRNPDHAKCYDCQQEISDQEANLADAIEEENIKEEIRTGRSATGTSGLSMRSIQSALPSLRQVSSGQPHSNKMQSEAGRDGIWVPRSTNEDEVIETNTNAPNNNYSRADGRARASSIMSDSTTDSNNTNSTARQWSELYPASQMASTRSRAAPATTKSSPGQQWEHIRAYKEDARTRAANRVHREKMRSEEEAEEPVAEEDEDVDDDDDEDPY